MSDMKTLLESMDRIGEGFGKTEIKKLGNNVEVNDEEGNTTSYDQATWDEMQAKKDEESIGVTEGIGEYDDFEDADMEVDDNLFHDPDFNKGYDDGGYSDVNDSDIGLDFEMEGYGDQDGNMDNDFESPDAEVDDNLFNDPDFGSSSDFDLGDDDIGMDFNFEATTDPNAFDAEEQAAVSELGDEMDSTGDHEFDDDDFDEPEYTPFDATEQAKRLRAGTPIVFDDSIGGGTGTFIEKSPSGFFGTAERNGKSISIHLSDIVAADLVNDNIYESFDYGFNQAMEGSMEGLDTDQAVIDPAIDAAPQEASVDMVTVTAEVPVDQLAQILSLSGLGNKQEEVYQQYGQEGDEEQAPVEEPSMQDMVDTVDDAEAGGQDAAPADDETNETNEGNEDYEDGKDFDSEQKSGYPGDNDDNDPFGETPAKDDDGYDHDDDGYAKNENEETNEGGGSPDWPKEVKGKHPDEDNWGEEDVESRPQNADSGSKYEPSEYDENNNDEEKVEEEFANEPDEKIASADTQLNAMAGGLNKPKQQSKIAAPGDNPLHVHMKMDETTSFLNLYKRIKTIDES